MRKWAVYILLAVCLSSCGQANGNKQVGFSNGSIADSIPAEAIRLKRQGNDLFNNGDLEDAHKYYIKAIELAPEYDTAFYDLGKVYSRLGDDKGNRKTIEKDIFGNITIRDDKGNRKTIEEDIFGNTIIRDDKGNRKTIEEDIFGNTIIRDNKGNRKTIKKDIFGNTIIEDGKGNRTTIKKDIFGNEIIESSDGHRKIIKKDIFGNTVIEDY